MFEDPATNAAAGQLGRRGRTALLAAFAASGASALAFEVIWTRSLSLVLGSTTHAVSTMLATFMAGLALGAFFGGRLADRSTRLLRAFALCEIGIGISAMASVPLVSRLPGAYLSLYRSFHLSPAAFLAGEVLLCAVVMLVPTTLMGATFPLVARALTDRLDAVGTRVGSAYTANTLGAVLGSLAAGFVLIPGLGMRLSAVVAGGINVAVGLAMAALAGGRRRTPAALALVWLAVAALVAGDRRATDLVNFYSAHRYLEGEPYERIRARDLGMLEPLAETTSAEGVVRSFRTHDGRLMLQVGGKIEGTTTADLDNTLLLAYLPVAAHGAPRSALVIGLGAGVTLAAVRGQVPEADLAEIHPGVLDAVRRFGPPGLLDGVRVHRNDARNQLLRSAVTYDLITSEPSYPTEPGVANLFTREFFALAASRLAPAGVMAQWLPYHLLTNDDVTMMLRTFASAFPHVRLYKVPASLDLILLGSKEPFTADAATLEERVAAMNASGRRLGYALSRDADQVRRLVADEPGALHTDDRPLLEFHAARNLRVGDLSRIEGGGAAR